MAWGVDERITIHTYHDVSGPFIAIRFSSKSQPVAGFLWLVSSDHAVVSEANSHHVLIIVPPLLGEGTHHSRLLTLNSGCQRCFRFVEVCTEVYPSAVMSAHS